MIPIFKFLLVLCILHTGQSSSILFYSHISSYSHRFVLYHLADALATRGHEVTFISPFHPRAYSNVNPNITDIVPKKFSKTMEDFLAADFDINFRVKKTMTRNVFAFYPTAIKTCEDLLGSPELKEYLDKTTSLDLLIMDNCMTECGMGIAYKYGAKHIYFNTVTLFASEHDFYGLIPDSSAVPEFEVFQPRTPLSFLERVENALISLHFRAVHYHYYSKEIDKLIRSHMKLDKMPVVDELARNMSLVLYTGDMVTDFSRSFPPMIVNVGGLHCKKGKGPEELPQNIREFLQGEVEGIVYISLGSFVVSSNLPEDIKQAFFQTMETFPKLKFLWKWNGQEPERIPKNLLLSKWFPQADILAHPKMKAFLTQSGRPSTLEAICNGVPMIAFPVLGDQDANANRVNDMGGNIMLEIGSVTKEELVEAIKKLVYDEGMRKRVSELQNILQDRPMSPLDTAVWWTEYVLRHKDTSYLRPAGFHQTWYQRRLLDVWAFLFLILLIILIFLVVILVMIFKLIRKGFVAVTFLCKNNATVLSVNKKQA